MALMSTARRLASEKELTLHFVAMNLDNPEVTANGLLSHLEYEADHEACRDIETFASDMASMGQTDCSVCSPDFGDEIRGQSEVPEYIIQARLANEASMRCNFDVLLEILSFLHLSDLSMVAMASSFLHETVHDFVSSFIRRSLAKFDIDDFKLFGLLHDTGSVISGSFALRCLFPGDKVLQYDPNDLDIYVPNSTYYAVLDFLQFQFGYQFVKFASTEYYIFGVNHVFWLEGPSGGRVNVIVASGPNAVLPIFSFHSTTVMNFISSTGIYSAYNALTKSLLYVPNNRFLISGDNGEGLVQKALEKYHSRGFKLREPDYHSCGYTPNCPITIRKLEDRGSFFFTFHSRPWIESDLPIFQMYRPGGGIVWCLGGECGYSLDHDSIDDIDPLWNTPHELLRWMPFFAVQTSQRVLH